MHGPTKGELLDVFRRQSGIISARQAQALSLSPRQMQRRVATGEWEVLRKGIYRHALFDEGPMMWLHAATVNGTGFISHRYAARLHGLEPYDRAEPEVTVTRMSFTRTPQLRMHESTQVNLIGLDTIDGLPVSPVERTIMDVAAVERRQWAILAAMDSAVLSGKTDADRLAACLKLHARRGRNGTVRFRQGLEQFQRPGSHPIGHASRQAAQLLSSSGIPYPAFEDRVSINGNFVAQTDLAWKVPLVGFLDGFSFHGSKRRQTNRDRQQRQVLRSAGIVVLEFTNDHLTQQPGYVISTSRSAFREATSRLVGNPSHYRNWETQRSIY